jgi:hypothetical protein
VSRDEYKGLYNTCNIKQMVSVHALMVYTILCFLVDEIIELKVLACSFEITTLKILSVTLFNDLKTVILLLAYRNPPVIL